MKEQQLSLGLKGLSIEPQQISQGQPHLFFSIILFYLIKVVVFNTFLINMSFFTTSTNLIFSLPLPYFVSST